MWVKRGILEKLFTFVGLVSSFNFKLGKKKKNDERKWNWPSDWLSHKPNHSPCYKGQLPVQAGKLAVSLASAWFGITIKSAINGLYFQWVKSERIQKEFTQTH